MAAADTVLTDLVQSDHEIDNKDVKKLRKHKATRHTTQKMRSRTRHSITEARGAQGKNKNKHKFAQQALYICSGSRQRTAMNSVADLIAVH